MSDIKAKPGLPSSPGAPVNTAPLSERLRVAERSLLAALRERLLLSLEIRREHEAGAGPGLGSESVLESFFSEEIESLPHELHGPLHALLRQCLVEAHSLEQAAQVAYLGPEGGYGYITARAQFGQNAQLIECSSVQSCLDQVTRGRAGYAVFPFESSDEGLSQAALDALADSELTLVSEHHVETRLDWVSMTGSAHDVEKVYLTASAHAACNHFLEKNLPNATLFDVRSPFHALQLAKGDRASSAIIPFGLPVEGFELVRSHVGDDSDRQYRYGIATSRPAPRSGKDTTALLFSLDDTAGALFDVLRHFAERGVNLKMLQSRPSKSKSFSYMFYVELSGHVTDRALVTAIESMKRSTRLLKVIGSFPSEI